MASHPPVSERRTIEQVNNGSRRRLGSRHGRLVKGSDGTATSRVSNAITFGNEPFCKPPTKGDTIHDGVSRAAGG